MIERRFGSSAGARVLGIQGADLLDQMAQSAMSTLRRALAAAHAGHRERARELCAAVLFEVQPMIAHREELRRALLHALLVAHGFRLLSRLFRALSGRHLTIVLLPDRDGPLAPPSCYEEARDITCTLDPRWIERVSAEDPLLRHWCAMLTAGPVGPPNARNTHRVPLRVEPA
jgi:hypothetical protein